MSKCCKKYLTVVLKVISIVTFINILVMYWLPVNFLLSSFSAVRIAVVALMENRYYLIPLGVFICALLFLAAISIRRQHIVLPILSLIYSVYDFIVVLILLISGLGDGYWRMYIVQTVSDFTLIVLLCIYCWSFRNRAGDG